LWWALHGLAQFLISSAMWCCYRISWLSQGFSRRSNDARSPEWFYHVVMNLGRQNVWWLAPWGVFGKVLFSLL
jgi:hypothetical protein